ncbi:MAG: hypothetical protein GVY21_05630 [Gammaproteobacteria bacterium]|nr:hypothetical protein [Gammaproteobacteria bacterium]
MSVELRSAIKGLDTATTAALGVLATASGYWTYLGVRSLLDDGSLLAAGGAVIYSVAVSVAIFIVWSHFLKFLPLMRSGAAKLKLLGLMAVAAVAIVAMSSWLNAAALAGPAAVEQHLAEAVEDYQAGLTRAHENALAAQSLLPDVRIAAAKFTDLAAEENASGALTGTAGSGTVVALLQQTGRQLDQIARQIEASSGDVGALMDEGRQHLGVMRDLIAATGPIDARATGVADEAVKLIAVISALEETSVAPAISRAVDGLARGFVRPVADGRSADLAQRQTEVVGTVEGVIAETSSTLTAAVDAILARPPAEPLQFQPMSAAEAVLAYAGDFVPAWAGAIAIDMVPAILVLIIVVVHGVARDYEGHRPEATLTLTELKLAKRALQELELEDLHGQSRAGVERLRAAKPAEAEPGTGRSKSA